MLVKITESLSNKYFIGEPSLIMRNGEWEKVVVGEAYTKLPSPDTFTSFEVLKTDDNELKTSFFCLQTGKTKLSKISNQKCILAVIPESFWDNTKIINAKEHGFFIETNGKVTPRLNPNKKHISVCYTSKNNKIHTYTIFTQLAKFKVEKTGKKPIVKLNAVPEPKPINNFKIKKSVERKTVNQKKIAPEQPKFYDKFKQTIKKY